MTALLQTIPDHVPPELVWDHDYNRFAAESDDPFRKVGELHAGPDIIWARKVDEGLGGSRFGWMTTRYAMMREVLSDTARFRNSQTNLMRVIGEEWKLIPLELDPPLQQQYRKVLEPFFSPVAINALDEAVRRACDVLVAGFADKTSCEFASEFAEKFPSYIFLDLMGMPKERLPDFLAWERGMLRASSHEQLVASMTAILNYMKEFVAEQRRAPTSDLMRSIVGARFRDERPFTDEEIVSICYMLYIGGLDTVYSTLGWMFWHIAQDQPLQQRLAERPDDATRATEELLRAFSAASSSREVIADMDFHGVRMRAGDSVAVSLPLAARDPQAYEDPHRIDIDREIRHIAFGTGPHTCLGLRLAKREIRTVLQSFHARFRNIRMPPGAQKRFHTGTVFGVDYLPLEWDLA